MRQDLAELKADASRAERAAQSLLAACAGDIFPCDALAVSVITRTLSLIRGFTLLLDSNSFTCAAPLVRLQLDSALRFHGIMTCRDPHTVASKVCGGVSLRRLKHSSGEKMTDLFLRGLLEKANPWLPEVYQLSSGYIHLSEQHFLHLLMQSTPSNGGTRTFAASDEEDYVPEEHRAALVRAFTVATRGVVALVEQWTIQRGKVTDVARLKKGFGVV
jgi:hypothetical protein